MLVTESSSRIDSLANCEHCGTEFLVSSEQTRFCCSGCEYVHRLIHDESLSQFYELQGGKSAPVGDAVFGRQDYRWLSDMVEAQEAEGPITLALSVGGISCVGCVWLIEKLFKEEPGGIECRINAQRGEIRLKFDKSEFKAVAFAKAIEKFGYTLEKLDQKKTSETSRLVWRLAICSAFALNAMLYTLPGYLGMEASSPLAGSFSWMSALFSTLSMVFGGSYFITRACRAAFSKSIHLDLPISLGLVVAYGFSWYGFLYGKDDLVYFDFVSVFVFLMLIGRWLQERAIEVNRNRLSRVQMGVPVVERLRSESRGTEKVPSCELRSGDVFFSERNSFVPVRSKLISSKASFNLSWITGESEPSVYTADGIIPSGSRLMDTNRVKLEAEEDWTDSLLRALLNIDERRGFQNSGLQRFIVVYLISVVAISFFGGGLWILHGQMDVALKVSLAILVVSCPCSIGIALPLVDDLAVARLRLQGLYPRSNDIWAKIKRIGQIVFDKTGTLTRSRLTIVNDNDLDVLPKETLCLLSTMVRDSLHPVAASIRERLMVKGTFSPMTGYAPLEHPGLGLEMLHEDRLYRLGKASWALNASHDSDAVFTHDGNLLAKIVCIDRPRPDTSSVFKRLSSMGKRLAILSGDNQEKVNTIASHIQSRIEPALGGLSPQDKASWIAKQPHDCLMIGDGINDSLAFEAAACSGTPITDSELMASKADFYYSGDGLKGVAHLFVVGSARRRAYWAILSFAIAYNVFAIGLALAGLVTPLLAAILMPFSSIISLGLAWVFIIGKWRETGGKHAWTDPYE